MGKVLSFHVKFVQTDRRTDGQTDNGKAISPPTIFRYGDIKMKSIFNGKGTEKLLPEPRRLPLNLTTRLSQIFQQYAKHCRKKEAIANMVIFSIQVELQGISSRIIIVFFEKIFLVYMRTYSPTVLKSILCVFPKILKI